MACEERILEELSNNLIFVVFYTSLKFGAVPLFIVLHYTTYNARKSICNRLTITMKRKKKLHLRVVL